MVYLKNIVLSRATKVAVVSIFLLMLYSQFESVHSKITYKRPIQVKSNAIKEQPVQEVPQKVIVSNDDPTDNSTVEETTIPAISAPAAELTLSEEVAALAVEEEIIEALQAHHLHLNKTIAELPLEAIADTDQLEAMDADEDDETVDNASDIDVTIESSKEVALLSERPTTTAHTTTMATTTSSTTSSAATTSATIPTTITTTHKTKGTAAAPRVNPNAPVPCTCGVFMTSQIKMGAPHGKPVIINELDRIFPCNAIGQKQCQTKCLETIVQHLPNSASILCATLDRDCRKERAYLFVKNCRNQWYNTNLAAGREYCCKNGQPYNCPLV